MDYLPVLRQLYAERARLSVIIETLERVYEPNSALGSVLAKVAKPRKRSVVTKKAKGKKRSK